MVGGDPIAAPVVVAVTGPDLAGQPYFFLGGATGGEVTVVVETGAD